MPINTDLNIAPYFDDYDTEDQFYKILFKPGYALQARELTQLQSILQNQIETFGDNIFQEGSIVRGCNFTEIQGLQYVKLRDADGDGLAYNPLAFISRNATEEISGVVKEVQYVYTFTGGDSGLSGQIIQAAQGYATRPPNLQTFFFQYTNNDPAAPTGKLIDGELLTVNLKKFDGGTTPYYDQDVLTVSVSEQANHTGDAFGVQATPGIIYQKGHFLFTEEQNVIVEKYSGTPDSKSLGYQVTESLITALQDSQLYDNAQGNNNFNAPGADRLKLSPTLAVFETSVADADTDFFTLIRYKNGSAVTIRDVSQYNVIGKELARRTHEESGDYIIEKFKVKTERNDDANNTLQAIVGPGLAYIKGYRIQNHGELDFDIDNVTTTETFENESVGMNYGGYLTIASTNGNPLLDHEPVVLKNGSNVQIGTAFVKNVTNNKLWLFGIKMSDPSYRYSDVRSVEASSAPLWGAIGTNDPIIKETRQSALIFNTGVFSVSNTDDMSIPVRTRLDGITYAANTFTITQGGGSGRDFDCTNTTTDLVFVRDDFQQLSIHSAEAAQNNSELNVVLDGPVGADSGTGSLIYNERILLTQPYSKTVARPYIKVSYSPTTSKYSLGFPDVFEILSIVDSSGTSYLNSFRLKPNQKDTHYDISYMEYIPGRPQPTGTLTIRLKVFRINSSVGDYFFTINSYPINDSTALSSGQIRSNELSVYEANNGQKFNLRECFDFRPYADKDPLADYNAITAAAAPTISTAADGYTLGFNADGHGTVLVPAVDNSITTDITSYNGRIDVIIVDSYGNFSYVKGNEDQNPKPPVVSSDHFILAEVQVPGNPALSSKEAGLQRKYNYAVRTKTSGVKRYTMADISNIDDKVKRLEYYVSLNQLEQSVESLQILDASGLPRFKNGYIVDPLVDLRLADLENPEYKAAVPGDKKVMTPSLTTFPLDLTYLTSTGATIFPTTLNPETATLSRNAHVTVINQPYATNYRTLTSNFYSYKGTGQIHPDHDFVHDISIDPVPLIGDLTAPIDAFLDDIQSFLPQTQVQTNNLGSVQVGSANDFFPGFIEETVSTEFSTSSTTQTDPVGDFVSNINFNPFMRSRDVNIYVSGLRPNTRHYFYFDGTSIDAHVREASSENVTDSVTANMPAGNFGAAISSNDEGVIRAIFRIPQNTFFVGERQLIIADVDDIENVDSAAASLAQFSYHSYNIDVGARSLHISTRIPQLDVTTTTTTRNVRGAARPQDPPPRNNNDNDQAWFAAPGGWVTQGGTFSTFPDPLAQTFFIKEGEGKGSTTIYASKIDVYFKRKSDVNGVTLQLREVINGYPSAEIIPFSSTHKHYSEVNISNDASAATTFAFESPVKLKTDTEYAIVLLPDGNDPNYLAFTSKVGGTDLTPGATQNQAVVQDWGDGVLFTSTNNKAWKSYQDEDLKFSVYRHDFNASLGSVTMKPEDYEFLTIENFNDNLFTPGEFVYQDLPKDPSTSSTVDLSLNGTEVTGTNLDATYTDGDYIHIVSAGGVQEDIFQILQVVSDTSMIVDHASYFLAAGATGTPVAVGKVSFQNPKKPDVLHLKESSATGSKIFSAGNTITGLDSGTTADITSVDNINLSYVHPIITAVNDTVTGTLLSGNFTNPSNVNANYNLNMKFGQENYFLNEGVVLYSRSNDTDELRPFSVKVDMASSNNSTSSPMVDIATASLIAYQYNITNDSDTTSKFITKRIDLAEDLDAEDIRVLLTAYRPQGTDIKVYIRPLHSSDPTSFDTIDWIELELTKGIGQFCSSSNIKDYREFEYGVADANLENDALVYTSTGGTFTGYRTFALKIELLSGSINNAPTVKDYRGIAIT